MYTELAARKRQLEYGSADRITGHRVEPHSPCSRVQTTTAVRVQAPSRPISIRSTAIMAICAPAGGAMNAAGTGLVRLTACYFP